MAKTASTTSAANFFAKAGLIFVAKDVFATLTRVARSILLGSLNSSRNCGMTGSETLSNAPYSMTLR